MVKRYKIDYYFNDEPRAIVVEEQDKDKALEIVAKMDEVELIDVEEVEGL